MITSMLLLSLAACSQDPQPIRYGTDACNHCQMTLMDTRFGCEMVTGKGKVHMFDDVNCLVNYMNQNKVDERTLSHLLFIDFSQPEHFVKVNEACFLKASTVRSPMASQVAVFSTKAACYEHAKMWDGKALTWDEVKAIFK